MQPPEKNNVRKTNWDLPSYRENNEELDGDLRELQSHKPNKARFMYIRKLGSSIDWWLSKFFTNTESTHLKLKEVETKEDNLKGSQEYQNLLLQKAKISFYGSFLAGVMGLTINCVAFSLICYGSPDVGLPALGGGFSLKASAYFLYKISQDANDRLDRYYGKPRDKDKNEKDKN